MQYDGKCKVAEFVFVTFAVDFRPGMKFNETLRRFPEGGYTYAELLANAYNAWYPGAAVSKHQIKILSVQNGYR